jgi:DNA-binding transcriptional regulator LsrR (DeoR family)
VGFGARLDTDASARRPHLRPATLRGLPVSVGYSGKARYSERGIVFLPGEKCPLVFTSKHVVPHTSANNPRVRRAARVAPCERSEPMKPSNADKYPDELVYRVVEVLFEQQAKDDECLLMKEIADLVEKEFGGQVKISRQSLYPLVASAVRRGFVRLMPPVNRALRDGLVKRFQSLRPEKLDVVKTTGPQDSVKVAAMAAERAYAALVRIAREKGGKPVGVGLGPGRATLEFCRLLSRRLENHSEPLRLRLVAITAGGPVRLLENAPTSFLNLFPEHVVESRLGLHAETLVRAGEFHGIRDHTGVKDAFAAKQDIDLIVTAMGDFEDPDDLLTLFLRDAKQDLNALRADGWIGNVQYRPYTAKGPVKEAPDQLRVVTVFELEDLVRWAKDPKKEVILMSRQCGLCRRIHARALRPLLTNPNLKVFSRLVLDCVTAMELLR